MVPVDRLLGFSALALPLIVVPGPSVLFVISRGVALGRRAALATVVGNAAGAYAQVVLVAAGLGAVVARSIAVFTAIKVVGAAYLIYLGVQAIRHRKVGAVVATAAGVPDEALGLGRIVRDGFAVGVANPKVIVFFAAILPQFVDPARGWVTAQLLVLGLVFVAIALVSDGTWGLVAGTARDWLGRDPRRLRRLHGTGGVVMVGLGVRLLTTGRHD
jgi:threonine/homoserine/homoserine lactone efflux protein